MDYYDTHTALVEKYINLVYKICITRLANHAPSPIEDACQQVFLKFAEKRPSFNSEEHERAWFIRVTLNVCNNIYKKHKRDSHLAIEDAGELAVYETPTAAAELAETIAVLPPGLRGAFCLNCLEGYSSAETARILRTTPAAVRMRVKRARDILQNIYNKEDFIYER